MKKVLVKPSWWAENCSYVSLVNLVLKGSTPQHVKVNRLHDMIVSLANRLNQYIRVLRVRATKINWLMGVPVSGRYKFYHRVFTNHQRASRRLVPVMLPYIQLKCVNVLEKRCFRFQASFHFTERALNCWLVADGCWHYMAGAINTYVVIAFCAHKYMAKEAQANGACVF